MDVLGSGGQQGPAQMPTIVMFLPSATRRMSSGSLVTTVTCAVGADQMAAPRCASATETPVRFRMAAAALAWAASSRTSPRRAPGTGWMIALS